MELRVFHLQKLIQHKLLLRFGQDFNALLHSGRWRAMASGLVAVASSSSAACGVVSCHANKGTEDNSVARSQWLFIEHPRENQTPM
jgi:hypothetical protein